MKKWYVEAREDIDKLEFKIHQSGQGIKTELHNEPFLKLNNARLKTYV